MCLLNNIFLLHDHVSDFTIQLQCLTIVIYSLTIFFLDVYNDSSALTTFKTYFDINDRLVLYVTKGNACWLMNKYSRQVYNSLIINLERRNKTGYPQSYNRFNHAVHNSYKDDHNFYNSLFSCQQSFRNKPIKIVYYKGQLIITTGY